MKVQAQMHVQCMCIVQCACADLEMTMGPGELGSLPSPSSVARVIPMGPPVWSSSTVKLTYFLLSLVRFGRSRSRSRSRESGAGGSPLPISSDGWQTSQLQETSSVPV